MMTKMKMIKLSGTQSNRTGLSGRVLHGEVGDTFLLAGSEGGLWAWGNPAAVLRTTASGGVTTDVEVTDDALKAPSVDLFLALKRPASSAGVQEPIAPPEPAVSEAALEPVEVVPSAEPIVAEPLLPDVGSTPLDWLLSVTHAERADLEARVTELAVHEPLWRFVALGLEIAVDEEATAEPAPESPTEAEAVGDAPEEDADE